MNPMYSNALSGLASGMASGGGAPMGGGMPMEGMPGHESEGEGGSMVPCPLCQGAGMISEDMLFGAGASGSMLPPRLAARGGGMPMGGAPMGGAMQMPPSSSPSPFPMS
jgi:hypothetical protein